MTTKSSTSNAIPYRGNISHQHRKRLLGQKSLALRFTALSGSGKSPIAHMAEERLHALVFDGDNVRHGLCGDLSFSVEACAENNRRIAKMLRLFLDSGIICMAAFISPMRADRQRNRDIVGADKLLEVHVHCPIEECERRDVKGLYKLARAGKIINNTGISVFYKENQNTALVLPPHEDTVENCVEQVLQLVLAHQ